MLARFFSRGVRTTERMYTLTEDEMASVFGSVDGRRWWMLIRGFDLLDKRTMRARSDTSTSSPQTNAGAMRKRGGWWSVWWRRHRSDSAGRVPRLVNWCRALLGLSLRDRGRANHGSRHVIDPRVSDGVR